MRAATAPPPANASLDQLRVYARGFNAMDWAAQSGRGEGEVVLEDLAARSPQTLDLEELRAVLFHVQRDRRWVGDAAAAFEQRQRMLELVEEIRKRLAAYR